MLFKSLHNNSINAALLTSVVVVFLWLRYFVVDITHFTAIDNPSMPLWDAVVSPLFGYSAFTAALSSLGLVFLTGLFLNRMAARYALLQRQSLIVLLIYAMLSSAFLSVQKLSPVWIFVVFFVLGLDILFGAVDRRNPSVKCFDAGLLLGLGSLLYAKGLFFFPLYILAMGVLRLYSFRALAASLMGLLFPFAMSFAYYLFIDKGAAFYEILIENLVANPGQYSHTFYSRIYMAFLILITTISILVCIRQMNVQKIIVRRYFRIFIWIILINAAAVMSPFFSMELMPLSVSALAVVVTKWFEVIQRNKVREIVFLFFILVTVAGQFFLY